MPSHQPVIVSAARTPIGRYLGSLAPLTAVELGAIAIRAAVERAGLDPERLDEVIMGNVVSAGLGQAPARQAALRAGVPYSVSAVTVNKVCASALTAVIMAAQAIKAGDGLAYVAGGMESMSNAPYLVPQARTGYRLGNGTLLDAMLHDGLWCAIENQHVGDSAEWIAANRQLSREDLDAYSVGSHHKAAAARQAGKFQQEIIPVQVPQQKGVQVIDADELPRGDSSVEALARLAPAFREGGVITAGNASALSDGAAATVVMDETLANELDIVPLARITGYASAANTPLELFACPPLAIGRLLDQTGMTLADFDLIEVNEAFRSQIVANGRELGWDWDRVNVNGGAIALGHPIGATGARMIATLISALQDRGLRTGLLSLCHGGGGAVAMAIELV